MNQSEDNEQWKSILLLVGAGIGAVLGAGAAYLYTRQLEETGAERKLAPTDAMRIGSAIVALLRQIADLAS
ncbi:MAG TPA: hypothetical protein PK299_05315 [Anaerolineales bacterium]|nr:hypothetical protein [Anaerolineales bacterium]